MSTRPLRIAYLDLALSREQYGLQPTRYGGGAVVARYLKEDPEVDFHIYAPPEAFDNVGRHERADRCHGLSREGCAALQAGYPVSELFSFDSMPDIILHPHTCMTVNRGTLNVPVAQFCGFDGTAGHPGNDYVLLYDDTFVPCFGERAKHVRIGKPVPSNYCPHPRAPYVFQCSRHDDTMGSARVAEACRRFGIQGYFAGPIHNGYPLLEHIDGKVTHYLGEIDEPTKLAYMRHARLFALAHNWSTLPFNQSIIEAQGQGCPIWATRRGPFLERYLMRGLNGFDAETVSLLKAFEMAPQIRGEDCWAAARAYDTSVMVASFKTAFAEIAAEWAGRAVL